MFYRTKVNFLLLLFSRCLNIINFFHKMFFQDLDDKVCYKLIQKFQATLPVLDKEGQAIYF